METCVRNVSKSEEELVGIQKGFLCHEQRWMLQISKEGEGGRGIDGWMLRGIGKGKAEGQEERSKGTGRERGKGTGRDRLRDREKEVKGQGERVRVRVKMTARAREAN